MENILNGLLDTNDSENHVSINANKLTLIENKHKVECVITNERVNLVHSIAEIDLSNNITIVRPINTIINSSSYFKSKYKIKEFIFEGLDTSIEEMDIGEYGIFGLPDGFIKTISFGLGIEKKYRILILTIQKYHGICERLRISDTNTTSIVDNEITISIEDFVKIRKGIDRNHEFFYNQGQIAKESFIYENFFNYIDSENYPKIKTSIQKEVIYKVLRNRRLDKISISDKNTLSLLKDTADLSYLTVLKLEFEKLVEENHKESTYQTFFEKNPLLLTFFSGSPFVKFRNQAYVGGKSFDNSNGQYPDFLQKHKLTNNTFIIEIKTPSTQLLDSTAYRDTGVYNPTKHLSGSITQLLTQKYQLETDISSLLKNAEDRDVEAYNVQSLLIIGKLSSLKSKNMIRSFELFRNNQNNLRILTYDECLEQLRTFIKLLSKEVDNSENELIE